MEVFIYAIWYSFYGQFDFINFCIMWAFGLSDGCGVFGNPLQQSISFGSVREIRTVFFMISGIAWDVLIYFLLFRRKQKIESQVIDDFMLLNQRND